MLMIVPPLELERRSFGDFQALSPGFLGTGFSSCCLGKLVYSMQYGDIQVEQSLPQKHMKNYPGRTSWRRELGAPGGSSPRGAFSALFSVPTTSTIANPSPFLPHSPA